MGEPPQRWYIPLGTANEAKAVQAACRNQGTFAAQGWNRLSARIPYEFALGIFWLESPMAVTYVTLFTMPKAGPTLSPSDSAHRLRLAVIEPDPDAARL